MAYTKTSKVTQNVTTATAEQYNSLMAEVKAAVEGLSTHDCDTVITYDGGSGGDLPDTITITDNSPAGDTGYDISCVGTVSYNADDTPSQIEWVFSELGITLTEAFTYSNGVVTAIGRTLS
jgi:alcohol dehydrogenase class IV